MRIALCFHGLSHGQNTLKDYGSVLDPKKDNEVPNTIKSFKKNIIEINDNVDVFFHTWINDIDKIKKVVSQYKPKLYSYEPQKLFNPFYNDELTKSWISDYNAFHSSKYLPIIHFNPRYCSKWYSLYTANFLKSTYEKMKGFKYDFVIHCRFDLQWNIPLIFAEYDKNYIYSAKTEKCFQLDDSWIFGNSDDMDIIASLYERIYDYLIFSGKTYKVALKTAGLGICHVGTHEMLLYHTKKSGIFPKIKQIFEMNKEYTIPKTYKDK